MEYPTTFETNDITVEFNLDGTTQNSGVYLPSFKFGTFSGPNYLSVYDNSNNVVVSKEKMLDIIIDGFKYMAEKLVEEGGNFTFLPSENRVTVIFTGKASHYETPPDVEE